MARDHTTEFTTQDYLKSLVASTKKSLKDRSLGKYGGFIKKDFGFSPPILVQNSPVLER